MKTYKTEKSEPTFLAKWSPLIVSCLILMTSCLLQHYIRGSNAYLSSMYYQPIHESKSKKTIIANIYIAGIFFSLFTGQITDMLGIFPSLLLFTILSSIGTFLYYLCIKNKSSELSYQLAMIFYGLGQILLRIPQKKYIAEIYEGPYLAMSLNIHHNASHIMGILGGLLANTTLLKYSLSTIFLLIFEYSILGVICTFLIPFIEVKNKEPAASKETSPKDENQYRKNIIKKNKSGFIQNFKTLFLTSDVLFYLLVISGCLIDSVVVSLKNIETYVIKKILHKAEFEQVGKIVSYCKILNLIGPFFSLFMDKYPVRSIYFSVSCFMIMCFQIFYFSLNEYYKGKTISFPLTVFVSILWRIVTIFFYASWYPSVALISQSEVRGVGFGFLSTINCTGFVLMGNVGDLTLRLKLMFYVSIAGFLLSLVSCLVSFKKGSKINKKSVGKSK